MASSEDMISLVITHKTNQYSLSFSPSETFANLQKHLHEVTSVPPSLQKLLYKGKKASTTGECTVEEAGLKDGTKVMLLGSTMQDVDGLKAIEAENKRKDDIMKQRAARGPTKVRTTASSSSASANYRFHKLEPLRHLPSPDSALDILKRLSNDPAIAHIMRAHQFSIGLLTELAPHEYPHLLGLNQDAGAIIKLRLRTDAYDGFRNYKEIRRVLCHELTHCVWGDHDDNFKILNSKLNREVTEYERSVAQGTHTLSGVDGPYEPELEATAQTIIGGSYILGGGTAGPVAPDSREERRRLILQATVARLKQEEKMIEDMCGSAGPQAENQRLP